MMTRIFPNTTTGSLRRAAWDVSVDEGAPTPLLLPPCRWLVLDPTITAPWVSIGVRFGGAGSFAVIRPGEALSVPTGARAADIVAHSRKPLAKMWPDFFGATVPNGSVAFLACSDVPPVFRSDGRGMDFMTAHLRAAPMPNTDPSTWDALTLPPVTPTTGLRGLRVSVWPRRVTGEPFTPAQVVASTLAATVRPVVYQTMCLTGVGLGILTADEGSPFPRSFSPNAPCYVTRASGGDIQQVIATNAGAGDLPVSPTSLAFDLDVPAGCIALAFHTVGLGGLVDGIAPTDLFCTIEGY